jgi:regulator of sigma E protease
MEYVIYFAITIGILVFIHEFGHFAAAKLCKMRADVFAIGFGKRLFGWNKKNGFSFGELPKDFDGEGHTDYRLSLLPLGGYVKIAGMVDESFDTKFTNEPPKPYEFRSKPMWQKIIVITAGVLMNFLLTYFVFWGSNYFKGKPVTDTTTIGYVKENSAVDSLGFKEGDKILEINGAKVNNWDEVLRSIYVNNIGEDITFNIEHDGQTENIFVPRTKIPDFQTGHEFLLQSDVHPVVIETMQDKPAMAAGLKSGDIFLSINNIKTLSAEQLTNIISANPDKEISVKLLRNKDTLSLAVVPGSDGKIGISVGEIYTGKVDYRTFGFFASFSKSFDDMANITAVTFRVAGKVFNGDIEFRKAFGGPVKIAQLAAKSADVGFESFLYFLAMLSLSLAIINILPFPVLDGGHLVMIIFEGIFKREIPVKIKIAIQNTGFILLLLLMAFIIYNDILSL